MILYKSLAVVMMMMLYNHSNKIAVDVDDDAVLANGRKFAVATGETIGAAVVARDTPLLFLNVMVESEPHRDIGGKNWARISRIDLSSGTTTTVLSPADLAHLTLPTGTEAHVTRLLSVSPSGDTLTVVMSVPSLVFDANGVRQGSKDNYGIYDMDVATKKFTKLRDLATPFG